MARNSAILSRERDDLSHLQTAFSNNVDRSEHYEERRLIVHGASAAISTRKRGRPRHAIFYRNYTTKRQLRRRKRPSCKNTLGSRYLDKKRCSRSRLKEGHVAADSRDVILVNAITDIRLYAFYIPRRFCRFPFERRAAICDSN